MSKRTGIALFLCMATLFFLANRAAYKGYFQDDELDNIAWTTRTPLIEFASGLVTPRFLPENFRPVGHLWFRVVGSVAGLDFPKYVFRLHVLHLFNIWLVWLLARRLGAGPFGAGAASLFFAFHMGFFDALWKPMYIFDVLCATFCLASILFWIGRRWVLSFVAFWLAYKSKELAVMLPAVLAAYEFWLGKRQWKPLLPFAAASLSFGVQALLLSPHHGDDYSFVFTPAALAKTINYYSGRIFLFPFAGLLVLPLAWWLRDRRAWFATAGAAALFVPLLFLPGRLFNAYTYVPLAVLALAMTAVAIPRRRVLVAGFFLLWIPWNYYLLRLNRRGTLAVDDENRAYVAGLASVAREWPGLRNFVYDGRPFALHPWGIRGALRLVYHRDDIELAGIEDDEARQLLHTDSVAVLTWDPVARRIIAAAHAPGTPDASYITMDRGTPIWQLGEGWYQLEGAFRWTRPVATARLRRPDGARAFEVRVNIGPDFVREAGRTELRALIGGREIGSHEFTQAGWHTVRWDLPPGPSGPVEVRFEVRPPYHPSNGDPRTLGIPVGAFGFVPGVAS